MKNLLVHLCNSHRSQLVVETAVQLASSAQAKIRGVSILDTRNFYRKATIESATYAGAEAARMELKHRRQMQYRDDFRQVCRRRKVYCEVLDVRGDPLDLIANEARYNDLTIVSCKSDSNRQDAGFSAQELMDLALRGVQPLLILRDKPNLLQRVLLIYDGSNASTRAIRSFMSHAAYLGEQYRLLGVGAAADPHSSAYCEMSQYCQTRIETLEFGSLPGLPQRTVARYARKWEADLLVLGVTKSRSWWGSPFGQLGSNLLRHTELAIYAYA